ncbi:MAG: phosphoglycerate kinase [Candidatus Hadarchaeales archaeon]
MRFPTLDDVDVKGKTVLLRVDINSPIDPSTGEILDDKRIRECAPTIRELASKGAKVVILAHQGRPGDEDFTTLEKHAKKMREATGLDVKYVEDVFGPSALSAIRSLKPGEVLLLENVRFCAEESLKGSPEEMAKTFLVKKLSSVADIFVNDAFGAAHRDQPSLVGFGAVLPTYAGRLMERELRGLGRALNPERPCVYVLGGGKAKDSMVMIENILGRGIADKVLTGGLLSQAFLAAKGVNIGENNMKVLADKGFDKEIDRAKKLLSQYGDRIVTPVDVVVNRDGTPSEISVDDLPTQHLVQDIGSRTVSRYSEIIAGARTVVANGPLGVFEKKGYERGTFGVLEAMARSGAFTVVGGGHMVAAAEASGLAERMGHVSTGGGACISFLSGEKLPVVEMLTKVRS